MYEVLVNRLGGLSLPRKSVVRLTDHPDMTLDVYRGRKTIIQQQQPLEYASEVWDGCTITDSNRLEQVPLTAAHIVTGLPTFSSLCSLYSETGWETSRKKKKQKVNTLA